MNATLANLYDGDGRKHNTLIELSTTQFTRFKDHSIHLANTWLDPVSKNIYYKKVRYGKYVNTTKQYCQLSGNKKSKWINMKKTKQNLILFTASKDECLRCFPNTTVIGSVMTHQDSAPMSGIVILMMATLRNNGDETIWTDDIHEMAKQCKTNSLSSYSHHQTKGFVYSFGN